MDDAEKKQLYETLNQRLNELKKHLASLNINNDSENNSQSSSSSSAEDVASVRRLAESGDADGQFYLGFMYLHGVGVEQSDAEALKWFAEASKQYHGDAMWFVGVSLLLGQLGSPQDEAAGIGLLMAAATDAQSVMAMQSLGSCYRNGIGGVARDPRRSYLWYARAAALNHAPAKHQIGHCYEHGWGVEMDKRLAVTWYVKAVHDRHTPALYDAGRLMIQTNEGEWQSHGYDFLYQAAVNDQPTNDSDENNDDNTNDDIHYTMALRLLVQRLQHVPEQEWPSCIHNRQLVRRGIETERQLEWARNMNKCFQALLLWVIALAFIYVLFPYLSSSSTTTTTTSSWLSSFISSVAVLRIGWIATTTSIIIKT